MTDNKKLQNKILALVAKYKRYMRVEGWDVDINFVALSAEEWVMQANRSFSDIAHQRIKFKFNLANAKKYDLDELIFHEMLHLRLSGYDAIQKSLLSAHQAAMKAMTEAWYNTVEETICDNLDSTISPKLKETVQKNPKRRKPNERKGNSVPAKARVR